MRMRLETAHRTARIYHVPHTQISRRVHTWLKMIEFLFLLQSVLLTSFILIHVSPHFVGPTFVFTYLHTFLLLKNAFGLSICFRCCTRRWVHPMLFCKVCYALADWPNNLFAGYEPSLSSKSAGNTVRLLLIRGSLGTDVDDLATILDESEVKDTTDVERLMSHLFFQELEASAVAGKTM